MYLATQSCVHTLYEELSVLQLLQHLQKIENNDNVFFQKCLSKMIKFNLLLASETNPSCIVKISIFKNEGFIDDINSMNDYAWQRLSYTCLTKCCTNIHKPMFDIILKTYVCYTFH